MYESALSSCKLQRDKQNLERQNLEFAWHLPWSFSALNSRAFGVVCAYASVLHTRVVATTAGYGHRTTLGSL